MRTATEQIDRLLTENEQLQLTINKLSKTMDGVPIVPGMTVYWMYQTARTEFCCAYGVVRYVETMAPTDCRNMWLYPILVETTQGKPALRDCYSTREAAEAAKKIALEAYNRGPEHKT